MLGGYERYPAFQSLSHGNPLYSPNRPQLPYLPGSDEGQKWQAVQVVPPTPGLRFYCETQSRQLQQQCKLSVQTGLGFYVNARRKGGGVREHNNSLSVTEKTTDRTSVNHQSID